MGERSSENGSSSPDQSSICTRNIPSVPELMRYKLVYKMDARLERQLLHRRLSTLSDSFPTLSTTLNCYSYYSWCSLNGWRPTTRSGWPCSLDIRANFYYRTPLDSLFLKGTILSALQCDILIWLQLCRRMLSRLGVSCHFHPQKTWWECFLMGLSSLSADGAVIEADSR